MLGKNKDNTTSGNEKMSKVETLIGRNTHFFGNLQFSGGLLVEGKITGNIEASDGEQATLILNKDSVVEGDVRVPNLVVHGRIKGNVYSNERVELGKTAFVEGDLHYKLIEMSMGAEVNGSLVRNPDAGKTPKSAKPETVKVESAEANKVGA